MRLHDDAFDITPALVRELVAQAGPPEWAALALRPAGNGTDNVMARLGDQLVVRLPQCPDGGVAIAKEAQWLRRLAPSLPLTVPHPRLVVPPSARFPAPWAVYDWIVGDEPTADTVDDWATFGRDLAAFVGALHAVDVAEEQHTQALTWYRGRPLADFTADGFACIDEIAQLAAREEIDLDVTQLREAWRALAAVPQMPAPAVLLHGDLRAANLLVRGGRLVAVIDFGTLSIGQPAAEHGPVWSFPATARAAHRQELGLADDAWAVSLGWALLPSLTGLPYYWHTWPEFARGCLERIRLVLRECVPA